jgi:hypothetical protein
MNHGVARPGRFLVGATAAGALALVLVRLLHTTAVGVRMLDAVPDEWWTRYHGLFGLAQEGNVERLQHADALAIGALCLVPAAGAVAVAAALLKRWRR